MTRPVPGTASHISIVHDMTEVSDPFDVPEQELLQHAEIIRSFAGSTDPQVRRRGIVEGLSRFGLRFFKTAVQLAREPGIEWLSDETIQAHLHWLSGDDILVSADEAERRARYAANVIDAGFHGGGGRLAPKAILLLPEGHPDRDLHKAGTALLQHLHESIQGGNHEDVVLTIGDLLRFDVIAAEDAPRLMNAGLESLKEVDPQQYGRDFVSISLGYCVLQARRRSTAGDADGATTWIERAEGFRGLLEGIGGSEEAIAKNQVMLGALYNATGHNEEAVAAFRAARESGTLGPAGELTCADIEASIRHFMGQHEEVVQILAPRIAAFEERYLQQVEPGAVERAGNNFAGATTSLAFCYAALDRWKDAIEILEHGKSLRLRHAAALRKQPGSAKLLELERHLHALRRGIEPPGLSGTLNRGEDWLGAEISLQVRILEQYRRERPAYSAGLVATPALAEMSATLADGDALICLGINFEGTLAIGVLPGDSDHPSIRLLLPALRMSALEQVYLGDSGWGVALGGGGTAQQPSAALEALLALLEPNLGAALAAELAAHNVRRLIVAPQFLYDLAPIWALPSLARYPMLISPSAAHVCEAARVELIPVKRAAVVGDPTEDLPLSPAETASVATHLRTAGIDSVELMRGQAVERAVNDAIGSAELFHFCGHGRADILEPLQSSLLLNPDWPNAPVKDAAAMAQLANEVTSWRNLANSRRVASIPGVGQLIEYDVSEFGRLERFLEHGAGGTLWASFSESGPMQAAELWTTGDLMVSGNLGRCSLAVLSACGSSTGALRSAERGGIPSALLLAGIPSVIATLWPVSDVLTVLFVDQFYARLAAAQGRVDLAQTLHEVQDGLREMPRETAAALLVEIAQRADDVLVQFELDAAAQALGGGEQTPFAHPLQWASFHVLGRGEIIIDQRSPPS